jgi:hypothetical protein
MSRVHPNDFDAVRMLINDIQDLESRAHRLMMIETGHFLNAAKNKAGWELSEQMASKQFADSLGRAAAKLRDRETVSIPSPPRDTRPDWKQDKDETSLLPRGAGK